MIPLLYFGRHVIQNGIRFSLHHISSILGTTTIASQQFLILLVVTTFVGVGFVHLLLVSTNVMQDVPATCVEEQQKNDDDNDSKWQWMFALRPRKEQVHENNTRSDSGNYTDENKHANDDGDGDGDDEDDLPVEDRMESGDNPDEYPYLLSKQQRIVIQKSVLPTTLRGYIWKRLYSVARDGDSFSTYVTRTVGHRRTLFVIQTSSSKTIGVYCDFEWKQSGPTVFEEDGVGTCLYRFENDDPTLVHAYRWTGENRFMAVCDRYKKRIGFGGGSEGSFGLCVDSNFTKGYTAPCPTFGNPPLCGQDERSFQVVDMEVYGFSVV